MMWTYCFLTFIVFLILLIIYLFTHKKTKGTKKPFRFVVWGVGILTNSPICSRLHSPGGQSG